jgi:hypothetical protein
VAVSGPFFMNEFMSGTNCNSVDQCCLD